MEAKRANGTPKGGREGTAGSISDWLIIGKRRWLKFFYRVKRAQHKLRYLEDEPANVSAGYDMKMGVAQLTAEISLVNRSVGRDTLVWLIIVRTGCPQLPRFTMCGVCQVGPLRVEGGHAPIRGRWSVEVRPREHRRPKNTTNTHRVRMYIHTYTTHHPRYIHTPIAVLRRTRRIGKKPGSCEWPHR